MFSEIRQGVRSWPLLAACLALLSGCAVDDYTFVEDAGVGAEGGAGGSEVVTPTVCESDEDCAELEATVVCDIESGYCVECLADREAELDRCPKGLSRRAG